MNSKLCDSEEQQFLPVTGREQTCSEQKYYSKLGTASRHPQTTEAGLLSQSPPTLLNSVDSQHRSTRGRAGTASCHVCLDRNNRWLAKHQEPHTQQEWALNLTVVSSCHLAPDKGNFREKGLVLAHSLKLQSTFAGKWRQQEFEAVGHFASTARNRKQGICPACFLGVK